MARARGETGSFPHQVIPWTLPKAFITVVLTLGPVLLLSTLILWLMFARF